MLKNLHPGKQTIKSFLPHQKIILLLIKWWQRTEVSSLAHITQPELKPCIFSSFSTITGGYY
jgi:hypothetical protein